MSSMNELLELWEDFPRIARAAVNSYVIKLLGIPREDVEACDHEAAFALLEPSAQIHVFESLLTDVIEDPLAARQVGLSLKTYTLYIFFRQLRMLSAWAGEHGQSALLRAFRLEALRATERALRARAPQGVTTPNHPLLAMARGIKPCPDPRCTSADCLSGGVQLLVSVGMECTGGGHGRVQGGGAGAGACRGRPEAGPTDLAFPTLGEQEGEEEEGEPAANSLALKLFSELLFTSIRDDAHGMLRQATLAAVASCADAAQREALRLDLVAKLSSLRMLCEEVIYLLRHTPEGTPLQLALPPATVRALAPFGALLDALGMKKSLDAGGSWVPLWQQQLEPLAAAAEGAAAPPEAAGAQGAAPPAPDAAARVPIDTQADIPVLLEVLGMANFCRERLVSAGAQGGPPPASAEGEWVPDTPAFAQAKQRAELETVRVGGEDTPVLKTFSRLGMVRINGEALNYMVQSYDGPCGILAVFNYLLLSGRSALPQVELAGVRYRFASLTVPFSFCIKSVLGALRTEVHNRSTQRSLYLSSGVSVLPDLEIVRTRASAMAALVYEVCTPHGGASVDPRLDGTFGEDTFTSLLQFLGIPYVHAYVPPPGSAAERVLGSMTCSEAATFLAGEAPPGLSPADFEECKAWASANLPSREAANSPKGSPYGLEKLMREGFGHGHLCALMFSESHYWVVMRGEDGTLLQLCTELSVFEDPRRPRLRVLEVVPGQGGREPTVDVTGFLDEDTQPVAEEMAWGAASTSAGTRPSVGGGAGSAAAAPAVSATGASYSSSSSSISSSSALGVAPKPWSCSVCTFENPHHRTHCDMCENPRAQATLAVAAASPKPSAAAAAGPPDPSELSLGASAGPSAGARGGPVASQGSRSGSGGGGTPSVLSLLAASGEGAAARSSGPGAQLGSRSGSGSGSGGGGVSGSGSGGGGGGGSGGLSADSTPSLMAGLQHASALHHERARRLLQRGLGSAVVKDICRITSAEARDARLTEEETRLLLPPLSLQ